MRETIQRVLAAEEEARRLVEAARQEREALLADSRRRALELSERAEREARRASAELLEAAAAEAHGERQALLGRASAELDASVRLDEETARRAVAAIVAWVRRGHP